MLRAVSARLEEENIPVEIDTTGYIEYNYNDNTQAVSYTHLDVYKRQVEKILPSIK